MTSYTGKNAFYTSKYTFVILNFSVKREVIL